MAKEREYQEVPYISINITFQCLSSVSPGMQWQNGKGNIELEEL